MAREITFGPAEDFESFERDNMADQCQRSLHVLIMVNSLIEEKNKLLANHGSALAVEKKKNKESSRRIASLEKQRDSLNFHLKEYERDFKTAKTELGVQAISLFKHSLAFKAFAYKEFVKGVNACKNLVRTLDYPVVADQIDESICLNLQEAELDLKKQVTRPVNILGGLVRAICGLTLLLIMVLTLSLKMISFTKMKSCKSKRMMIEVKRWKKRRFPLKIFKETLVAIWRGRLEIEMTVEN
ncbi:hypothetical protein LWI29_018096 [Acer saccharum]|uniref:Uncharacterized protein n=1 Tax=Acer saccharum TaxID=4024 RepID=A0AA39SEX9_ACESA|nr:hypothetical protein LWI29_018096 [Acer saccharum]